MLGVVIVALVAAASVVLWPVGASAEGRPIEAYGLGHGPHTVVVVGGIHGAYEINTAWLVWELVHYFEDDPDAIADNLTLLFVPEANPDGLADGTRFLADGVDPNRNWPTEDWDADTFEPGALRLEGGGGPEPFSEPETLALASFIQTQQPVAVVSYHSAGGMVIGGPMAQAWGLADAYVEQASGYRNRAFTAYPVTGDFVQWCEELGVPAMDVELWDHDSTDFERNQAGLLAVLALIAETADQSY
jgi:Zinc carboxypeptidase